MADLRTLVQHPASLLAWLPLLVGLQGIPHTGAVRTLFLVLGIVHAIWLARLRTAAPPGSLAGVEKFLFWALSAWLTVQSAMIAQDPWLSLKMLAGDWGKLLLMVALGWAIARVAPSRHWVVVALFAGAFLHVVSTLARQLVSLATGGGLVFQQSLLADYALTSPFTTTAIAWLLADGFARIWHGRSLFPWSAAVSAVLALLSLAAEALLMAKSGQVISVILILVATLSLLNHPSLKRQWSIGIPVVGLCAIALVVLVGASRWTGLHDSFNAAWYEPIPVQVVVTDDVPLSGNLNHSFYMRAVRARVGVEGIAEHPWGLGFDPDVFNRYVTQRFAIPKGISSSNSGLIDFTLANGIIGAALLLLLAASLMRRGWLAFVAGRPEGAALSLLVLHQLARYALDGTLGGSRFTGVGLILGAVWALSVMAKDDQSVRFVPVRADADLHQ